MAKRPEDPRITDLRRYRQQRERARKGSSPQPPRPNESFLGSHPKARLILAVVIVVLAAVYVVPLFL